MSFQVTVPSTGGTAAGDGGVGIVASNLTQTSGTITLTGAGDITVATAAGPTIQISGTDTGSLQPAGNTAGTTANLPFAGQIQLAAGNNLTFSQSSGASSTRVTLSAAAQSSETGSLVPAGNTAGTTASLPFFQNIQLAGGNNLTVSQSSGASSTRMTLSAAQDTASLLPLGNTTGTTASIPMSNNWALAGGNNITISGHSDSASRLTISAASQSVAPVGSMAATGNTVGTMATIPLNASVGLEGGNNITISQSSGASSTRFVISGPNTAASNDTGSLVPGGNTVGTTASLPFAGQIQLSGGNNITISQSSGTNSTRIGISGPNTSAQQTGISGVAASNTTYTSGTITFTGVGGGITVSSNTGQRIDLSVAAQTVQTQAAPFTIANWVGGGLYNTGGPHLSQISKSPVYHPVTIPGNLTMKTIAVGVSETGTSVNQSFSIHYGLYSIVNSTSLSLMGSASDSFSLASTNSASYTGRRHAGLTSPGTHANLSAMTAGEYVMGWMFSAGASQSMDATLLVGEPLGMVPQGRFLVGNDQYSNNATQGLRNFWGVGASTVNALAANVGASDIQNQGAATSPLQPHVIIRS